MCVYMCKAFVNYGLTGKAVFALLAYTQRLGGLIRYAVSAIVVNLSRKLSLVLRGVAPSRPMVAAYVLGAFERFFFFIRTN